MSFSASPSYYQAEGISIGSGEVESTIKQIAARPLALWSTVEGRQYPPGSAPSLCLSQWSIFKVSQAEHDNRQTELSVFTRSAFSGPIARARGARSTLSGYNADLASEPPFHTQAWAL